MPVRFVVALHAANLVAMHTSLQKPQDCLDATWGRQSKVTCGELLQSSLQRPQHWPMSQSFDAFDFALGSPLANVGDSMRNDHNMTHGVQYLSSLPKASVPPGLSRVVPKPNGFVDTVLEAYSRHHHLIIRPDDVWLAILSQFNFYVNANEKSLRSYFVAHEGKKDLVVTEGGTRYSVDFGKLARLMSDEIEKNVVAKDLKDWILPDFTTTTNTDTVAAAVLMMSTLKTYFNYTFAMICGIPSVTLEGSKEDWQKLLPRIDRLKDFGKEPEALALMLRPILTRFVQAFEGEPDIDFWSTICHHERFGSGSHYLGGWITAFSVWNEQGKWTTSVAVDETLAQAEDGLTEVGIKQPSRERSSYGHLSLEVDGIRYPRVDVKDIPPGYGEVDVKLDDNGEIFDCLMVAGHMGMQIEGARGDAVRPHPAWFMFIKGTTPESSKGSGRAVARRDEL